MQYYYISGKGELKPAHISLAPEAPKSLWIRIPFSGSNHQFHPVLLIHLVSINESSLFVLIKNGVRILCNLRHLRVMKLMYYSRLILLAYSTSSTINNGCSHYISSNTSLYYFHSYPGLRMAGENNDLIEI